MPTSEPAIKVKKREPDAMKYLGGISGEGVLVQNGKDLAKASYDFDGYLEQRAGITCNGELRTSASVLGVIFGLANIKLRTDNGRLLELQFSGKTLTPSQEAVHVDVRGQVPEYKREWRRRTMQISKADIKQEQMESNS